MHLLWISTKPPWPAADGGRLAQALTLEALARDGARITVVTPTAGLEVEAPPGELEDRVRLETVATPLRSRLGSAVKSWLTGRPTALLRHDLPVARRRVGELVAALGFDAVHVEQLHAWSQAVPAGRRGLPCLLRAQNVESDLWRAVGEAGGLRALVARREARLLARAEGRIVGEAATAVALTEADATRLSQLAGGREVLTVPPPFPARLAAASAPLSGAPPLVALGSGGWWPNRDADEWLVREIWPRIAARVPGGILHRFGGSAASQDAEDRIVDHSPPADSREAFAQGAVLLVPLRIASGMRMKILEAWARGVPVVATPTAAAGLDAEDGRELLLATDPEGFAAAVERVESEEGLRERLILAGRRALETRHDGAAIARRLRGLYVAA